MSDLGACTPAWRRRISAYHDGGLPGAERALVEDHLRGCPECQQLLTGYDKVYRDLRGMPGFEGLLTITKPGTRRGLGGTMRPTFTWPGKNTSSSVGPYRDSGRRATGGPIIVTLLVLLALGFLVGRTTNLIGPSASATNPLNAGTTPTFAPFTLDGVPCANAGQTTAFRYVYSDNQGHIFEVKACGATRTIATMTTTDLQFDALAPDNSQLLLTSPALPNRKVGQHTHLYVLSLATGSAREIALTTNGGRTTYSADEVAWLGATTVIVRSQNTVLQVNLTTDAVTLLGISATHIVTRGTTIFYSVSHNNQATLHRLVLAPKEVDTTLLALGAGSDACATPQCWQTIPWDVSADGKLVAYPTPIPAQPLTATPISATLVLQNLQTNARTNLGTVALTAFPTSIVIAPDGRDVSVIGAATQFVVFSADGRTLLTDVVQGRCAWRPDDASLIIMPYTASATQAPQLITVASRTSTPLGALTTNYLWEI